MRSPIVAGAQVPSTMCARRASQSLKRMGGGRPAPASLLPTCGPWRPQGGWTPGDPAGCWDRCVPVPVTPRGFLRLGASAPRQPPPLRFGPARWSCARMPRSWRPDPTYRARNPPPEVAHISAPAPRGVRRQYPRRGVRPRVVVQQDDVTVTEARPHGWSDKNPGWRPPPNPWPHRAHATRSPPNLARFTMSGVETRP